MEEENKNQINDYSDINTDEIFDKFFKDLNIKKIQGGDVKCEQ